LLNNKKGHKVLRCYLINNFKLYSWVSSPPLPYPPPPVRHSASLFFLSQDLIHSINQKARTGIKETQDTRFFWYKDQGWWHNKSHEFFTRKKKILSFYSGIPNSTMIFIMDGRRASRWNKFCHGGKKYIILQRQLKFVKSWADLRCASELRCSCVYMFTNGPHLFSKKCLHSWQETFQLFLHVHKIPAQGVNH